MGEGRGARVTEMDVSICQTVGMVPEYPPAATAAPQAELLAWEDRWRRECGMCERR